ncbi:HNH endonuclease signature motif containing protein [Gulosibacter chungangensis]|uniref:DUF222 domain-containing protein n=1 Tax=Gulosibacter chungangensis TaxID=979746 RepID=A0A7J5BB18_9MICO|nr:HNH endonuclease signature motif containing protein [Gulosibacter chungangensis]KAB1643233.1 DUF222 domain-containing protein [Gulosibacter chungangensis]
MATTTKGKTSKSVHPGERAPRATTGRHSPADDIRADEAREKLDDFTQLRRDRGAAEAGIVRLFATVYDIATERTLAAMNETFGSKSQSKVFSWHFTSLVSEFAIKTNDSPVALRNRAYDAYELVRSFPDWVTSIEEGKIDLPHARAMLRNTGLLQEDQYAKYGSRLLEYAETHSVGQTAAEAERLVAEIAAEAFEKACKEAREDRFVRIRHDSFGMADIHVRVPSELGMAVKDKLDKEAKALRDINEQARKDAVHTIAAEIAQAASLDGLAIDSNQATGASASAGLDADADADADAATSLGSEPAVDPAATDSRTTDQIRADILIETLLCATPGESRVVANINLTIPALSVLEGREDGTAPALLNGMHPISFPEACQLAANAPSWQRVLNDPISGHVIAVTPYRPPQPMRTFIQVRDRSCRFPGCMRPATHSEIDHTHPASEGGETSIDNLAVLCRSHHVLKHEKPWTVINLGDGVLEWRTPLGQVVVTEPMPYSTRPDAPASNSANANAYGNVTGASASDVTKKSARPEFRPTVVLEDVPAPF